MLHFEQRQLFAILKALQEFQINWFGVLHIQHNIGALQLVIYPCVLHRFTRWFFATICCSDSMGVVPFKNPYEFKKLGVHRFCSNKNSAWRSPNHTQEDTTHIDYSCRFLRFRVCKLNTRLKLCYVCSKGNRSHKNQKSYCSTCNSHDKIGSGEM